jgi:AAA15 family ATPase/GTPase
MIIEFSVGNFRSFKETVTFSMLAADLKAKYENIDENNVFETNEGLRLLKSAAIYGANASGKSNFIHAIEFMHYFVFNSINPFSSDQRYKAEAFRLDAQTVQEPSHFELVFMLEGKRYRYGFELDSQSVSAEWLYFVPTIRETKLFERNGEKISLGPLFKEGKGLQDKTRGDALFLTVAAQFNGSIAKKIHQAFNDITFTSNFGTWRQNFSAVAFVESQSSLKDEIKRLIKSFDVGISDISVKETQLETLSIDNLPKRFHIDFGTEGVKTVALNVLTSHLKIDKNGETSYEVFDLDENESDGTKKLFDLAGPLLDVLKNGRTLIVDELDARMHPLITSAIIGLFNSNETNPQNAQLIFATHDSTLLKKDRFRRDQIWFAEKDRFGATHLYSLAEFKVRNDASYGSDYIKGKYGAIPYIGNLNWITENSGDE